MQKQHRIKSLKVLLVTSILFISIATMGASTNVIIKAPAGEKTETVSIGGSLRIKFEDNKRHLPEHFYLKLTGATWLAPQKQEMEQLYNGKYALAKTAHETCDAAKMLAAGFLFNGENWYYQYEENGNKKSTATYHRESNTQVKVVIEGEMNEDFYYKLPIPVHLTGGRAFVSLEGVEGKSTATNGEWEFDAIDLAAASLSIGYPKPVYVGGELSPIILEEVYIGAMKEKAMLLKIQLTDGDHYFVKSSIVKAKGLQGFKYDYASNVDDELNFYTDKEDASIGYILLRQLPETVTYGQLELTGLEVDSMSKNLGTGKLIATISTVSEINSEQLSLGEGANINSVKTAELELQLDKSYENTIVADVEQYGAYIRPANDQLTEIVAGREEEVNFKVVEAIENYFIGGEAMSIYLEEGGYFWVKHIPDDSKNGLVTEDLEGIVSSVDIIWENGIAPSKAEKYTGKAIGFKVVFRDKDKMGRLLNDNRRLDEFSLSTNVYIPIEQKDKASLSISGETKWTRNIKAGEIIQIKNPFNVTVKQATLLAGEANQVGGQIVLTETDKAMLNVGNLKLGFEKGGQEITQIQAMGAVSIKTKSDKPSALNLSAPKYSVDKDALQGYYNLILSGDMIDVHGGSLKVEDYIVVGIPNEPTVEKTGIGVQGTTRFVMGADTYVMNGTTYSMDAPAFIQEPGYVMVPLRYVANAFGIEDKNITSLNGEITLFVGGKTITLRVGSKIAVVNGGENILDTPIIVKEGRTYIPAGEIASLIGVEVYWDSKQQAVIFAS